MLCNRRLVLVRGSAGHIFPCPNLSRTQMHVEDRHCYSKHYPLYHSSVYVLEMWTTGFLVIQQVLGEKVPGKDGFTTKLTVLLSCVIYSNTTLTSSWSWKHVHKKVSTWYSLVLVVITLVISILKDKWIITECVILCPYIHIWQIQIQQFQSTHNNT